MVYFSLIEPMMTKKFFGRREALPDFGNVLIAGVDEAGRGALAGPVIAGAVILSRSSVAAGYRDSKTLDSASRERLSLVAKGEAVAWAVGRAEVREIDEINILNASLLAMARAIASLAVIPDLVLIDGNRAPDVPFPCHAIVGGDSRVASISAASIVAKVERDLEMLQWHRCYPNYNFASHKGYPTREHICNLDRHGVSSIHRQSYRPVRERSENRGSDMVTVR